MGSCFWNAVLRRAVLISSRSQTIEALDPASGKFIHACSNELLGLQVHSSVIKSTVSLRLLTFLCWRCNASVLASYYSRECLECESSKVNQRGYCLFQRETETERDDEVRISMAQESLFGPHHQEDTALHPYSWLL